MAPVTGGEDRATAIDVDEEFCEVGTGLNKYLKYLKKIIDQLQIGTGVAYLLVIKKRIVIKSHQFSLWWANESVQNIFITHITKYIPASGALVPVVAGSAARWR